MPVCRNNLSQQCSGGEQRRLTVAMQLLQLPSTIFLDEPTSGLDAAAALHLSQLLASMAAKGRTVVMTLQQPRTEIFCLIDQLMLMSKHGETLFCGNPGQVVQVGSTAMWDLLLKCPNN